MFTVKLGDLAYLFNSAFLEKVHADHQASEAVPKRANYRDANSQVIKIETQVPFVIKIDDILMPVTCLATSNIMNTKCYCHSCSGGVFWLNEIGHYQQLTLRFL